MRKLSIFLASLAGTLLLASSVSAAASYETEVTYGVNLRSKPSLSGKVYRMLKRGEDVHVISEASGNWLKVETKSGTIGYISASDKYTDYRGGAGTSGETAASGTNLRTRLAATAKSYNGDFDYKWGAEPWNTNNKYVDCSSFMEFVFRKHSVDLPRSSRQQAKEGSYVRKSNLRIGDLVFFDTNDDGRINHVGMYIGDGEFIHASPSFDGVGVSNLRSGFWSNHYVTARNVL
ncbi:SH3 domain-containing C40 family peptidase [Paenibacillus sp.]|uniref:C40 family peptidase n=1 Tax=Paenibacillus sp. TaxID=58172 RepID=UPI002D72F544|nr:SH3 domain-containing C40 family peptidase [Paenibacillus sp.]HZG86825.1 SH3 domain-containing C40 family peptidase [Paenibacillus sp.]